MKRIGNLYQQITSIENLRIADVAASKHKGKKRDVVMHFENREINLFRLQNMFLDKTYQTSTYSTFNIYEPKERIIFKLPFFPDRIAHHAIMNVMQPIFISTFTADTYSCIPRRGIHPAAEKIKKALRDVPGTEYCLKIDIKKFYPNVDHEILKQLMRRKVKCKDSLWLMDGIIDSAPGLPIGNYLSQYFANFYLTYFDHWIKERMGVKYYFRYADDMVFLSGSKEFLHRLLSEIRKYLREELKLEVKGNYQIFPVAKRGIDVLGYVFFHTHTLIRKSIKQNFARMVAKSRNQQSTMAYKGWLIHCNAKHLTKKLLNESFQRPKYKNGNRRIYWRQNQNAACA